MRVLVYCDTKERINAQRTKLSHLFGPTFREITGGMMCGGPQGYMALFFLKDYAADDVCIAHEVFHLTHAIMDYCECKYDWVYDEPFAHLHGVLFGKVVSILREFDKRFKKDRSSRKPVVVDVNVADLKKRK